MLTTRLHRARCIPVSAEIYPNPAAPRCSTPRVSLLRQCSGGTSPGLALTSVRTQSRQLRGAITAAHRDDESLPQYAKHQAEEAARRAQKELKEAPTPNGTAVAYGLLGLVYAGAAVYLTVAPDKALEALFRPLVTPVSFFHKVLAWMVSLTMAAAATTAWSQQVSLQEGLGSGELHRRLDAALFAHALAMVVLMVLAAAQDHALSFPACIVPAGLHLAVLAVVAWNTARVGNQDGANPLRICLDAPVLDSLNPFRAKRMLSAAYALVGFQATGSGLVCVLAPLLSMALFFAGVGVVTPIEVRLWQAAGAGLVLVVGPMASTLREATDLNVLASKRGKTLAVGLATTCAGALLIVWKCLQAELAGPLQLPMGLAWALGFLTSLAALLKQGQLQDT